MMDVKQAAAAIGECEYRDEGSRELWREMRESRLVAVFGASDDLTELRGAVDDEVGTSPILFDANGMLQSECDCEGCPYWERIRQRAKAVVRPIWDSGKFNGERWAWRYETAIPHETFRVMEDGEPYCLGIVFSLDALSCPTT